jgi:hypothetical protein
VKVRDARSRENKKRKTRKQVSKKSGTISKHVLASKKAVS